MVESHALPWRFLRASGRSLLPNLIVDVGGTMLVFLIAAPHFASSSIVPLLAASLVPVIGNVFSIIRSRRVDVIGVIVFVGILASIVSVAFGGGQRLLLLRESFATGGIGLALFISPIFPKPIGYFIIRRFIMANEESHGVRFERLYESPCFRRMLRRLTFFWGVLLLVEFGLRVFMAFTLPVVFVVAASPLILNVLTLLGGVVSAIWMSRCIRLSLGAHAAAQ